MTCLHDLRIRINSGFDWQVRIVTCKTFLYRNCILYVIDSPIMCRNVISQKESFQEGWSAGVSVVELLNFV